MSNAAASKEASAAPSSTLAHEFFRELNSVRENQPPVTKAKMGTVVREALKALKYYKHVVYHVETFIKNCESEFKVAGLYVIDAIIRHSRSQYASSDLFAPRFATNLSKTFKYVLRCPMGERDKVTRVLTLWQRNEIFTGALVAQLLEMTQNAPPPPPPPPQSDATSPEKKKKQLSKLLELKNNLNSDEIDANVLTEIHKITSKLLESETKTPKKKLLDDDSSSSGDPLDLDDDYREVEKRFSDTGERLRLSLSNCSEWLNNKFGPNGAVAAVTSEAVVGNGNININSLNLTKEQKELYNNLMAPKVEVQCLKRPLGDAAAINESERKRKGLPPVKDKHLCVLSKTLWIGHLAKSLTEQDLKYVLEQDYSAHVIDIHMIPPRGCAYIQFERRREASKCLDRMRDVRIHGNTVKIAWAANKGVKDLSSRGKATWDGEHGCTFIPWHILSDSSNFTALCEGGTLDEDTLSEQLRSGYLRQNCSAKDASPSSSTPTTTATSSEQPPQMPESFIRLNQPPPPLMPQLIQFAPPPPPPMRPIAPPPPPGAPNTSQGHPLQLQFSPFQVIRTPAGLHQLQLYQRAPHLPHQMQMQMLAHNPNQMPAHLIRQLLPPGAILHQMHQMHHQEPNKLDSAPQFIQFARHPLQNALAGHHQQFALLTQAHAAPPPQPVANVTQVLPSDLAELNQSHALNSIDNAHAKQIPQLMNMNFGYKDFNELTPIKNTSDLDKDRDEHTDVDNRDLRRSFDQNRRGGTGYDRGGNSANGNWRNSRFSKSNGDANSGRNGSGGDRGERFGNSFRNNRFKHEQTNNELVINNSFNSNLLINNYNINGAAQNGAFYQSHNNGSASGVSQQVDDMNTSGDDERKSGAYRAAFYLNQASDANN